MTELADQQNIDNESLTGEIPSSASTGRDAGEGEPASRGAASPDKPLSLRQQIEKNVEAVRTEEAKRARAADGKFTKLDGAAEKPATTEQVSQPAKEASPEASKAIGPPPGWSAESKAFYNSLPADHPIKRDVAKREEEVSNGFKAYSEKAKSYEAIDQVLAPVRTTFQQAGIQSDADAVKALVSWEASFRNPETRLHAFQNLARTYGVDLSTLVQSSPSGSPSAAQDIPEPLRPVIDQFGNVVQEVQSIKAQLQASEQQRIEADFKAFADNGHPHFGAVRGAMGQLMQAGLATDLESAYQKAIALDPEISAQIRAGDDSKRAEEAERAKAEKARQAAAAAVSPSGRSPVGQPSAPNAPASKGSSARESILNAVRELREGQRA